MTIRHYSASARARPEDRRRGSIERSAPPRYRGPPRGLAVVPAIGPHRSRTARANGSSGTRNASVCNPAPSSSLMNRGLRTNKITGAGKQPFGRVNRERIVRRVLQELRGGRDVHRERPVVRPAHGGIDAVDRFVIVRIASDQIARIVGEDDGPTGKRDARYVFGNRIEFGAPSRRRCGRIARAASVTRASLRSEASRRCRSRRTRADRRRRSQARRSPPTAVSRNRAAARRRR